MQVQQYISRIDSKNTHGWQVRRPATARFFDGRCKFFSDSKFGGKESALAAAIVARDKLLSSEDVVALPISKSKHSKNQTKLIGVAWVSGGRGRKTAGAWLCYWSESGVQRKKSFNAMKYGFVKAWEMAVKVRMEHSDVKPSPAELEEAHMECMKRFLDWV